MLAVEINNLHKTGDAEWCARVMTASEPWVTLERGYEESLQIITDLSKEVYLSIVAGARAGFMILNMQGAFVGYVQTICVAPEFRGKRIGSRLLEFAEDRIFAATPNVFLCVSSFNDGARSLYERAGYQTVGELTDYLVRGHSEILMRKTLGPLKDYKRDRE